jgi:hypothetical protein
LFLISVPGISVKFAVPTAFIIFVSWQFITAFNWLQHCCNFITTQQNKKDVIIEVAQPNGWGISLTPYMVFILILAM